MVFLAKFFLGHPTVVSNTAGADPGINPTIAQIDMAWGVRGRSRRKNFRDRTLIKQREMP